MFKGFFLHILPFVCDLFCFCNVFHFYGKGRWNVCESDIAGVCLYIGGTPCKHGISRKLSLKASEVKHLKACKIWYISKG